MTQRAGALLAVPPPITDFSPTLCFESERGLVFRPVCNRYTDRQRWFQVRSSPDVTPMLGDGKPVSWKATCDHVKTLAERWKSGNCFSAFFVFERTPQGLDLVGIVALDPGEAPGEAILSYLFLKKHWHQGKGKDAVTTIVRRFAPSTILAGKTVNGSTLTHITATSRIVNAYSTRILDGLPLRWIKMALTDGVLRHYYELRVDQLVQIVGVLLTSVSKPLAFLILNYMERELGHLVHTWIPSCIYEMPMLPA